MSLHGNLGRCAPADSVDQNCEAIVALDMAIAELRMTRLLLVEENRRKSGKRTSA